MARWLCAWMLAGFAVAAPPGGEVVQKAPAGDGKTVELVRMSSPPGTPLRYVLRLMAGARELRVIDDFKPASNPTLEQPGTGATYLHFYRDYGFYDYSVKYTYDVSGAGVVRKQRYQMVSFRECVTRRGALVYTSRDGPVIEIRPRPGELPEWTTVKKREIVDPVESERDTPVEIEKAGIRVRGELYPVPVPGMDQYRRSVPQKQAPLEIQNEVGPYAIERGTVWFASTFYDGEGISGIGSIGRFDLAKKRYSMLWPPELAPWSGSALLLDDDDVWVGLMRRPEGAEYGAGLLRYNRKTGALTSWQFRDYVYTIHRSGDAVYCGTENGVWMVRDGQLTQLRFEPGETGRLTMVVR